MIRITIADCEKYAKKKGISIKDASRIFDRNYTPVINGWIKYDEVDWQPPRKKTNVMRVVK